MNMDNKYWVTHPDCENGNRLLTCLSGLKIAQEVGSRYGDKTQITLVDDYKKFKSAWVLNGIWKELKLL